MYSTEALTTRAIRAHLAAAKNPITRREGLARLLEHLPESLPAITELICIDDPWLSSMLVCAFCAHADRSVPLLEACTRAARTAQSVRAVEYIEHIFSTRAAAALSRLVGHWDRSVRKSAMQACARRRIRVALPALIDATEDYEYEIREAAVRALGYVGDPTTWVVVAVLLEDEWVNVRRAAARSLGRLSNPEAIPALLHALRDPDQRVRFRASDAISQIANWHPETVVVELLTSGDDIAVETGLDMVVELEIESELVLSWVMALLDDCEAARFATMLASNMGPESVASLVSSCGNESAWMADWAQETVESLDLWSLSELGTTRGCAGVLYELVERRRPDWERVFEEAEVDVSDSRPRAQRILYPSHRVRC